jgi:predicted MFS family arabinose efflux permease
LFRRVFKAFEHRDFRVMWIGACTSSIGTWMQSMAQSWLVYEISKDPKFLGFDSFLGQLPIMLLSLIGGVFADRTNRRNQLLMSQYIQMTCAFLLTVLLYLSFISTAHPGRVWVILCVSFVVGVAQAFGGPAYQALLPSLVGKEDMSNAIVLNSIQFNVARVIGPTIGGVTRQVLGAVWCFGLNGLSFLAVIASLYMINPRYVPEKSKEPILDSMKKGIQFIREREGMNPLIVLAFLMTMLGIPLTVYLPVFAAEVFKGGAGVFTLLLVSSGTGSVCGALIVAAIGKVRRQGLAMLVLLGILGTTIVAFSFTHWLPLACVLIFLCGSLLMASFSLVATLVQAITTDDMRGRVMSVYNVAFRGGMPVGSLALGPLVAKFGVSATIGSAGALLVGVAAYFIVMHRRVANL